MAMTLHVDIVGGGEPVFSSVAELVTVRGESGELGIQPGHASLTTRVVPGTVRVKVPDQTNEERIFVDGGILKIRPGLVTVVAGTAIRATQP